MKLLFLLLLASLSSDAQTVAVSTGSGRNQPSPIRLPRYHNHPYNPLLFEDFENPAGYDLAGWQAVSLNGSVNPDDTTNVLYGAQSLAVVLAADDPNYTTNSFAASSHVWVAFRLRVTSATGSSDKSLLRLLDASGNCQFRVTFNSDRDLKVWPGCGLASYVTPVGPSLNTTYNVWVEYFKDNGANSYASVAYAESGIKPTSGNAFVEGTSVSSATDVSQILIGNKNDEGNFTVIGFIIDHLIVDSVAIPSYP